MTGHPDGTGALNTGSQSLGKSRGGAPEMPLVVAAAQTVGMCSLSAGRAHDAPEGHKRLRRRGSPRAKRPLMIE